MYLQCQLHVDAFARSEVALWTYIFAVPQTGVMSSLVLQRLSQTVALAGSRLQSGHRLVVQQYCCLIT